MSEPVAEQAEARLVGGRFAVERPVGHGAMGAVFRCTDLATGGPVAVKRMTDPACETARFAREARLLARLDHPAIVRYVGHGEDAEGPWIAMEWVEGTDLSAQLTAGPLPLEVALDLACQLAEAVAAAHHAGVLHRDLKPANVMVTRGAPGRVKLVDFGIAREIDATLVLTATGALLGTPLYMAPEQLRGEPASPGSDVYSLATVIYELASGRPPFVGRSAFAAIGRILLEPPRRLDEICPDRPAALGALLERALAKEVSARPSSAELAGALRQIVRQWLGAQATAVPPPVARPAADLAREQRTAAVLVVRGTAEPAAVTARLAGRVTACDALPDGTLLALVVDPRSPDTPLLRAVRLALELHRADSRAVVVLASATTGVEQASVAAVALERVESVPASAPGVHLHPDAARLIGDRFELAWTEGLATVLGERCPGEERLLLGRRVPMVGRDAELTTLAALLASVRTEQSPRSALIVGPPGSGKSRLRFELMRQASAGPQPIRFLLTRFEPGSEHAAFGGLAQAIRSLADVPADAEHDLRRAGLGAFAASVGLSATQISLLAGLAGVATAGDEEVLSFARAAPEAMREAMREVFAALVRGFATGGAAALLLDDAHWADAASLALADDLLACRDMPVAVLAFARPELLEQRPDLWKRRAPVRMHLGPLGSRAAARLARAALACDPDERVLARVVELGAGSPLVIEELVRGFVATGELAPSSSARAVFEARIGRLAPIERLVARTAAVVGEVFWDELLAALLATTDLDVHATLGRLCDDEVVTCRASSRFSGATEYVFRHALVRDAAEATVPADVARDLHAQVARWLERRGEPDPAAVARHAELGGLGTMAGKGWAKAGRSLALGGATEAAIAALERALRLAPGDDPDRLQIHLALEELYRDRSRHPRRARHLVAARRAARRSKDGRAAAAVLVREARWHSDWRKLELGQQLAERAIEEARVAGAQEIEAEAIGVLSSVWLGQDLTGQISRIRSFLARAAQTLSPPLRAELLRRLGICYRRAGQSRSALDAYQRAMQVFESAGARSCNLALLWNAKAYAHVVRFELAEALAAVGCAQRLLAAAAGSRQRAAMEGNLAVVHLMAGAYATAAAHAERALSLHDRHVDLYGLCDTLLLRAQAALGLRKRAEAREYLRRAEHELGQCWSPYDAVHALLTRAWLLRAGGDPAELVGLLERACETRGASRTMGLVAQAELSRAALAMSRHEQALATASSALAAVAQLDGSEWGPETFEALLDVFTTLGHGLASECACRAAEYLAVIRANIGDAALLASFDRRPVVMRLQALCRAVRE